MPAERSHAPSKEELLEYLCTFTKSEEIYRRYHDLAGAPDQKAAYLKEIEAYAVEHHLIIPEVVQLELPEQFTEQTYYSHLPIGRGSDVNVARHLRYTPVFRYSTSFFEIYYALSGTVHYTLNDVPCVLPQGDISFIAPGVPRSIEVFDDSVLLSIHVRHDTFAAAFSNTLRYDNILSDFFLSNLYSREPISNVLFHTEGDPDLRDLVLDMYREAHYSDDFSFRMLNHLLSVFFIRILRRYEDQAVVDAGGQGRAGSPVPTMLSYIYDHFTEISLDELAEKFNYSASHCSRLIRTHTGRGFQSILRDVRMQQACSVLLTTGDSVAEVSAKVGYANPESFIRAFEKQFGVSPTAFRKQNVVS